MNAPRQPRRGQVTIAAGVFALVAAVGITAAVLASRPVAGPVVAPSPTPSATPSVAPTYTPILVPSQIPTQAPAAAPGSVGLDNVTGHDVTLLIHDETGTVVGATSGKPGDGMSVRWHDSIVTNVSANTIAITWVGLPGDDTVDLGIVGADGGYALTLVQPGPVPYSDAMGEDRVLVLTFDGPVSADDVSVEVLDRTVD